ncbi:MAG TPA: TIGR01777 family protein [Acidimicrobiaceae bacterium]|nr:TIGR01777 family protein [Acidimicrobiaceae bacterium]HCB37522.1 TIGR01777 family protein [Acidimicrobiaceae bacterium]
MRVVVAGATGLIGRALTRDLTDDGHEVVVVTRGGTGRPGRGRVDRSPADAAAAVAVWNPAAGTMDEAALEGADAVVNLAGESIAGRWTAARKAALTTSRAGAAQLLAQAVAGMSTPPRAYVGASAVGYYGDRGDERLTEAAAPGTGFLSEVCVAWEAAAEPLADAGLAVAHARFGLVLAAEAAATRRLMRLGRAGLLGPLGGGRQWWSWVTLHDAVRALRLLIDRALAGPVQAGTGLLLGPVNVSSPEPLRQRHFVRALAKALHRPAVVPAPGFAVRAALGEMGPALLLDSTRAVPAKLTAAGFTFDHADFDSALRRLLEPGQPA